MKGSKSVWLESEVCGLHPEVISALTVSRSSSAFKGTSVTQLNVVTPCISTSSVQLVGVLRAHALREGVRDHSESTRQHCAHVVL